MVGVVNTFISFCIIYVLIELLFVHDLLANFLGYVSGFISSFFLNRAWTFKSEGSVKKEGLGFVIVFSVCYTIQFLWQIFLHSNVDTMVKLSSYVFELTPDFVISLLREDRFRRLTSPKMLMQISGIFIFSTLNFSFNKIFTFKKDNIIHSSEVEGEMAN